MERAAHFSPCRTYRYFLTRVWDLKRPMTTFIGLNPSTADETTDDPTIRRCIDFARSWGSGGFIMVNLFAYRATLPSDMMRVKESIGPDNDLSIVKACRASQWVVIAWGRNGDHRGRDKAVLRLLRESSIPLHYFKLTKYGQPWHPLFIRKGTELLPWSY